MEKIENSTENQPDSNFNVLANERALAEKVADKVWYSGLFIDSGKLHEKFPPKLKYPTKDLHVTTNYKPDVQDLHLSSLGSKAKIIITGYANDGKNEGLLVRIEADDPAIQKALDERKAPDKRFNGELRPVPTHITLSTSEEGDEVAAATKYLDFKPLDEPFELDGAVFKLCMEDGSFIDDIDSLKGE